MAEARLPLKLPPGLYRNGTRFQALGRWADGNLVRFFADTVQPVGGWRVAHDATSGTLAALTGIPRAAVAWRGEGNAVYVAVATVAPARLYVIAGGVTHDITPSGLPAGRASSVEPTPADPGVVTSEYGSGDYGEGYYGAGSSLSAPDNGADTWQLDVFGDYLVAVPSMNGTLYVWEGDLTEAAIPIDDAPPQCSALVVTPERYLLALGAGGNVRAIMWPSQESLTEWAASEETTAGSQELATNGGFRCGRRTRKETLLWTDTDLHVATYIGGSFIYRFDQAGAGCGIIAPNACATYDTSAIWMSRNSFFTYDGYVKPLPCDMHDEVFGNLNRTQTEKVWAATVAEFGEVWFFYPSGTSEECDRYVTFNYREGHWSGGQLARTAGVDAGATVHPIFCGADGIVYEHEVEQDRGSDTPFLESGPIQLGNGDAVFRVQKLYPDERTRGDVHASVFASMATDGVETEHGPYALADETDVRLTARLVRLRIEQVEETDWRVGVMQLGVVPAGRR